MQAIRRSYLYIVALISLEIVVWGSIRLTRSFLAGWEAGQEASSLAGALSLVLIGMPVFGLHWWLIQRDVARQPEERSEMARALFLHLGLLANLIPAAQNAVVLLDRTFYALFGLQPSLSPLIRDQSLGDNVAGILLSLAAAAILFAILKTDFRSGIQGDGYGWTLRIYRYVWLLYGLGLTVLGMQGILEFILGVWNAFSWSAAAPLADGLALLLGGLPVWVFAGERIRRSLLQSAERAWPARLQILYVLVLFSAVGGMITGGLALGVALQAILGSLVDLKPFFHEELAKINNPLSLAIPLGVVWAYYNRELSVEIQRPVDGSPTVGGPRLPAVKRPSSGWIGWIRRPARLQGALPLPGRAGLRRLYYYTLALLGLGAVFLGLLLLLGYLVNLILRGTVVWGNFLLDSLAASLAPLLIGLPVWTLAWRPMQREAEMDNELGEYARRSVIRKGYLFLVVVVFVFGLLFSAGSLLAQLLAPLLGDAPPQPVVELALRLRTLALFALFLVYHRYIFRLDSRLAERVLARRRALYPVLILAPEEGDFGQKVASALEREAAGLPIAIHSYRQGVPDETLSAARAVILPAELAIRPTEGLRLWLQGFDGPRLVVPTPTSGWHWIGGGNSSLTAAARHTARIIRHLAEGEDHSHLHEAAGWMVLVYVMAGLFALELLLGLGMLIASWVGRL